MFRAFVQIGASVIAGCTLPPVQQPDREYVQMPDRDRAQVSGRPTVVAIAQELAARIEPLLKGRRLTPRPLLSAARGAKLSKGTDLTALPTVVFLLPTCSVVSCCVESAEVLVSRKPPP